MTAPESPQRFPDPTHYTFRAYAFLRDAAQRLSPYCALTGYTVHADFVAWQFWILSPRDAVVDRFYPSVGITMEDCVAQLVARIQRHLTDSDSQYQLHVAK